MTAMFGPTLALSTNAWLLGVGWGGLACALALIVVGHRRRRWLRLGLRLVGGLVGIVAGLALGVRYRPWPAARTLRPHAAITVEVSTRDAPRPVVISIARVDLRAAGLEVVLSEPGPDGKYRARTTTGFVEETGSIVGVNTHFFFPFSSSTPWEFYPRVGDPVSVSGIAFSDGVAHSRQAWTQAVLHFDADAHAVRGAAPEAPWDAVSGRTVLVADGVSTDPPNRGAAPRTALGIDASGSVLWIAVVDGRQPGYSEGMTLPELAELMVDLGASEAIEVDGGGSSALAVLGADGRAAVINSPIHTRIPGRERPVAAHLGIRVAP